jgi:hypothetical protein
MVQMFLQLPGLKDHELRTLEQAVNSEKMRRQRFLELSMYYHYPR